VDYFGVRDAIDPGLLGKELPADADVAHEAYDDGRVHDGQEDQQLAKSARTGRGGHRGGMPRLGLGQYEDAGQVAADAEDADGGHGHAVQPECGPLQRDFQGLDVFGAGVGSILVEGNGD